MMVPRPAILLVGVAILSLACGCQVNNRTREIRSDEAMLEVSFESARAEELFIKAVNTTYGDARNVTRLGLPFLSIYSRSERVAWNANCNDHIRKMDTDGDLVITEQEAASYYDWMTSL
jgi:hypothetical protein